MRAIMVRFRIGLFLSLVLVIVAVLVTRVWGPLFGIWDWKATAAALLLLGAMGLALVEEFFRTPNPYSRTYHLYDLRDVRPGLNLYSASPSMLWQALPPVVVAVVLILVR